MRSQFFRINQRQAYSRNPIPASELAKNSTRTQLLKKTLTTQTSPELFSSSFGSQVTKLASVEKKRAILSKRDA